MILSIAEHQKLCSFKPNLSITKHFFFEKEERIKPYVKTAKISFYRYLLLNRCTIGYTQSCCLCKSNVIVITGIFEMAVVAERSKATCNLSTECSPQRTQVRIPLMTWTRNDYCYDGTNVLKVILWPAMPS